VQARGDVGRSERSLLLCKGDLILREGDAAGASNGAASGRRPRAGCSGTSLTISYLGVKNHIYHLSSERVEFDFF